MRQEDKEVLLKDLAARLPYGVKCHFKYDSAEGDVTLDCIDNNALDCIDNNVARFEYGWYGRFHVSIDANYIKPYLHPMSSMTEEEENKYNSLNAYEGGIFPHTEEAFDWLNAHHFDYRGLIGKGLAIEAPEGMYN